MSLKRVVILTGMSWFLAIGCGGDDAAHGGTSLEGPYTCGANECTTGQVCRTVGGGVDSGLPSPQECATVPDSCVIEDCFDTGCPACIEALCEEGAFVSVSGRELGCGYP